MRVLFIKLGAIGDIIQSAVALYEYRARFPDAEIDWITGTGMESLVAATGVADRVIALDESAMVFGALPKRIYALGRSMIHVARKCAPKYDSVLTGYLDRRSKVLTWGVRCRIRRSLGDRSRRPAYLLTRNRVHEYWRLLTSQDSESIDIAAATSALGRRLLQQAGDTPNPLLGTHYVVVAAGGARNLHTDDALRRWPIQSYRALVTHLLDAGRRVVLVGAGSDRWVSEAMRGLPVDDLIGETTLMQLLAIMQSADAVVCNDSGPFHLATLTTAPLVGLFGPTPANAVAPMGRANTRILASDNRVSCSPCYDGKNFARCSRNLCLESIPVNAVADAIAEVARKGTPRESGRFL
jgi:heptosyltransferase-2